MKTFAALEERRKAALEKIEAVANLMDRTKQVHNQRSRLAKVLESVNDEPLPGLAQGRSDGGGGDEGEEDLLISPSTRSMAWWQRLRRLRNSRNTRLSWYN